MIDEPSEPAEHDQRDGEAVRRLVDVVVELVEAGIVEPDLEGPVAHPLEHVAHLVRSSRAIEPSATASDPRPLRDEPRLIAIRQQPARVRLRDLEHVEVGVDLSAHGGERRDRLVQHHEARRETQVQRVDELEPSRITCSGSMSESRVP